MEKAQVRQAASSLLKQLNTLSEKGKSDWASWVLAQQVNKLLDAARPLLDADVAALLPVNFRQGGTGLAGAKIIDLAAGVQQIVDVLYEGQG